MIIVRGKQTESIDRSRFEALVAPFSPRVTIDLGTGDGRFAYRYAQQHLDRFVVGIDPVRENLRELSARAARRPSRGGVSNLLYVVASIEHVPPELAGSADEMYITLPWGSLMRGLILADGGVLRAVASLARPGAALRIVLNTRIFDDPVPIEVRDLPDVTPFFVWETLAAPYTDCGLVIRDARWMDADEVAGIETTWAKRLSHRSPPPSVYIEATIGDG